MQKDNKQTNLNFYALPEPDHEMLIWEKWIQIRKEETTNIGKRIKRAPVDLTMNLIWDVREDKERKTVLEHAQIEKKPKVRDNLWEQAPRLSQKCYCKPVYEIHRTPAEMGRPNPIEHIAVPMYIKETEMGMTGKSDRKKFPQLNSDYENYREKREFELKDRMRKINPFRPLANELVIKGSKPATAPKKMPPLPSITVTPPTGSPGDSRSGIYAVRINNTLIYKNIPGQALNYLADMQNECWNEKCTSWTYYFNISINKTGRATVFLQNFGTVTLRFCWKKIKRPIPFIPEDIYEQVFFFNKNEDVLSPGQSKYIHFTFISEKAGIYSEMWELTFCNICFFDTLADKLIINLTADAVTNSERMTKKVEILKYRIDRRAVVNMITELINEAFAQAFVVVPQIYPYKKLFIEAQFFVMKNPMCFYHQTEVAKMKELYTEMVPRETWDLSINTWRKKMMQKDYEDRMKYYELLQKSHSDFLKPWYEGDELSKHKYRTVKLLLQQLANKIDVAYERISEEYVVKIRLESVTSTTKSRSRTKDIELSMDSLMMHKIRNLFYLHVYEHVATTIELCAGVLSSLDLDRWIEFDFCRL